MKSRKMTWMKIKVNSLRDKRISENDEQKLFVMMVVIYNCTFPNDRIRRHINEEWPDQSSLNRKLALSTLPLFERVISPRWK